MATHSQIQEKTNGQWFVRGLRNGVPICLGYFAVSFALGIAARNGGLHAFQAFLMSLMMVASAGEFAAVTLITAGAGIVEMIITSLIVNLRYFLMSCSLTQKLRPGTPLIHRFLLAQGITDEIFGLSVSVDGWLNPFYTYGMLLISASGWCAGTVLGVIMGNILPGWMTNGLNVAMYGMFLAIIIPPSRKSAFIGGLVIISMAASGLLAVLPVVSGISSGFRIILLTVLIAGIAAVIKPVDDQEPGAAAAEEHFTQTGGEQA